MLITFTQSITYCIEVYCARIFVADLNGLALEISKIRLLIFSVIILGCPGRIFLQPRYSFLYF